MPTMSSYELKVTGLVKDVGGAPGVGSAFKAMFPAPLTAAAARTWVQGFLPSGLTTLKQPTTVQDESWEVLPGSTLAPGSVPAKDSILNGVPLSQPTPVTAPTRVTSQTVLAQHTLLAAGTVLQNEEYGVLVWRAGMEDSSQWTPGAPGPQPTGKYHRLDFHAVIGVVRSGALGQHWARQTAQDDLEWFYNYKTAGWFTQLMGDLLQFNSAQQPALEEEVRVRALQWYCGNGGGP